MSDVAVVNPVPDPNFAVWVLWDIESLQPAQNKLGKIEGCIKNSLKKANPKFHVPKGRKIIVGANEFLRVNSHLFTSRGWSCETTPNRDFTCAESGCGFRYFPWPIEKYGRVKEVADRMIIQKFSSYIMEHGPPKYVLLITKDSDFGLTIDFLQDHKVKVLLARGNTENHSVDTRVEHVWHFSQMSFRSQTPKRGRA